MEWFVRTFLKASLAWLTIGVTLGVAMAAHPAWAVYRTAHLHANVLGFVAMMIFGVAYHVIPRFAGNALHSARLARAHVWLANVGLVAMLAGFALVANGMGVGTPVLAVGGLASAAGAYAFAYNLWRTIDGPTRLRAAAAQQGARQPGRRALPQAGVGAPAAATGLRA
jgi:cbb3-type cytochrome oxidase subunit 1